MKGIHHLGVDRTNPGKADVYDVFPVLFGHTVISFHAMQHHRLICDAIKEKPYIVYTNKPMSTKKVRFPEYFSVPFLLDNTLLCDCSAR